MNRHLFFFFLFSLQTLQIGWTQTTPKAPLLQQGLLFSIGSQIGSEGLDGNLSLGYFASLNLHKKWYLYLTPNVDWYQNRFKRDGPWSRNDDESYTRREGWVHNQGSNINIPFLLSYNFPPTAPFFVALGANFAIPIYSRANWQYDLYYVPEFGSPGTYIEEKQVERYAVVRIHNDFVAQFGMQFDRWRWAFNYTIGNRRYFSESSFQNSQYNLSLIAYYRLFSAQQL